MQPVRLALLVFALLPAPAPAGANRDRGQDEVGPGPDEGLSYFGVVLEVAGKPVDDARVTATSRDGLSMVTRSNAAGAYSLPGFNKGGAAGHCLHGRRRTPVAAAPRCRGLRRSKLPGARWRALVAAASRDRPVSYRKKSVAVRPVSSGTLTSTTRSALPSPLMSPSTRNLRPRPPSSSVITS